MARHGESLLHMSRIVGVLALSGWLSACALVPHYERPNLDLPQTGQSSAEQARAQREAMASWWRRFDDPVLDRLIGEAMSNNLDIALAGARIREARAQLGLANAQFYPTLGGQIEASRTEASLSANPQIAASGADRYSSAYAVSATLGYELNLFSALAGRTAAQAQLLASDYSRDAIRLATVGDIVANYMTLRALQRKIRITKATIKTREEDLTLAEKRFKYGAIGRLALLQKRALLSSVRSQLPQLRQRESRQESALAILTGKTAREIMQDAAIKPAPLDQIKLPGDLPTLLPSALINRRPDIRAAEAALVDANARVSVAKAQYFPSLNLTALIGSAAMSIGDLFQPLAEQASVAGLVSAPLLTFGRIGAQVDTAEAQRQIATIMYRQAVRQAFSEVRDALMDIKMTQRRVVTNQQQVEAYRKTLALAKKRYTVGRVGLRDVLDAQRQLYTAQLELSGAIRDRFVATANLFKALGGGWTDKTDSVPDDVDAGLPQPGAGSGENNGQAGGT